MLSRSSNAIGQALLVWISLLLKKLIQILFPIVVIFFIFGIVLTISVIIYSCLRYILIPKAIISEPIYFNFALNHPTARINILTNKKQWNYVKDFELESTSFDQTKSTSEMSTESKKQLSQRRFLMSGSSYVFEVTLTLPKSERNMDLGKFMIFLRLFDSSGDSIANSSRPIPIPYQSQTSLFIESLMNSPTAVLGFGHYLNSIRINTQLINNFVEPLNVMPPTEMIELSLSSASADVSEAYLTVMPSLQGLTYFMYYYPWISFFSCVAVICSILMLIVGFASLIVWLFRSLSTQNGTNQGISTDIYEPPPPAARTYITDSEVSISSSNPVTSGNYGGRLSHSATSVEDSTEMSTTGLRRRQPIPIS